MASERRDKSNIKFSGVLLIIFGAIYIVLGTLAVTGVIKGSLPGHDNQAVLVIVLAYINGILPIITGIACEKMQLNAVIVLSALFTIVSVVSFFCIHSSLQVVSIVDTLGAGFGAGTFIYALRYKALDE